MDIVDFTFFFYLTCVLYVVYRVGLGKSHISMDCYMGFYRLDVTTTINLISFLTCFYLDVIFCVKPHYKSGTRDNSMKFFEAQ